MYPFTNKIDSLLIRQAVPDSVTAQEKKFVDILVAVVVVIWACQLQLNLQDIGLGCDHLLCGGNACNLFVLQVSNGTTEVEISVDSAKMVDKAAGFVYAFHFGGGRRLVVEGEWESHSIATQDTS